MSEDTRRDPAAEREYLEAVESLFSRLRARPLVLSPEDTQRVLRWCREGVPLSLVLDATRTVFRNAAGRRPRRPPRSLAYVEPAVEEAWQDVREGRTGRRAAQPAPDDPEVAPLLVEAARAVRGSRAPEPERERAAAHLEALAERNEEVRGEDVIGRIDAELLEACRAALTPTEREQLAREAERDIAPWAGDMEESVRHRARERAETQRLRERFALPDLALLPLIG